MRIRPTTSAMRRSRLIQCRERSTAASPSPTRPETRCSPRNRLQRARKLHLHDQGSQQRDLDRDGQPDGRCLGQSATQRRGGLGHDQRRQPGDDQRPAERHRSGRAIRSRSRFSTSPERRAARPSTLNNTVTYNPGGGVPVSECRSAGDGHVQLPSVRRSGGRFHGSGDRHRNRSQRGDPQSDRRGKPEGRESRRANGGSTARRPPSKASPPTSASIRGRPSRSRSIRSRRPITSTSIAWAITGAPGRGRLQR